MLRYSKPPVLMHDVITDLDAVLQLIERQAPYTPLGGWYNPGADPDARTRPMWFQNDYVHDTFAAPGSDLFLHHEGYIAAAKEFYDAEVVEPHSVYVNFMAAIAEGGPAHTDNPRFHGRDRSNTPMWVLRMMLWSGLFNDFEILQATAIWWMNDVEGGPLLYWPNGPDQPPAKHGTDMANTALIGDNHGMFHQVGAVGPFDQGTVRISPSAQLAPTGNGEWAVSDHGELMYQAPLNAFRISVLWKANVYVTEAERRERSANQLSMSDVAHRFNADLDNRSPGVRFDLDRLDDPSMRAALAAVYPEARPMAAMPSVFESYP